MTRIVFLNRFDRLKHRKECKRVKARNEERRRRQILRELALDGAADREETPSKDSPSRMKIRGLAPALQQSSDSRDAASKAGLVNASSTRRRRGGRVRPRRYVWFRDRHHCPPPKRPGWSFLSPMGWTLFDSDQTEALELAFVTGARRTCKVPAGATVLERAVVDLDRMLLVDPVLTEFHSSTDLLPPALPVRRCAQSERVVTWRYSLDDAAAPDLPFDANDSEVLTLAQQSGRPCVVLCVPASDPASRRRRRGRGPTPRAQADGADASGAGRRGLTPRARADAAGARVSSVSQVRFGPRGRRRPRCKTLGRRPLRAGRRRRRRGVQRQRRAGRRGVGRAAVDA